MVKTPRNPSAAAASVTASVSAAPAVAAPALKDASLALGGTQASVVKAVPEDGKEIEIKDAVLKLHRRIVELDALRALAAINRLVSSHTRLRRQGRIL